MANLSEQHWSRILVILVVTTLSVRFLFLWLFEYYDPSFLTNNGSLIDDYLIPRLTAMPWKVDWSYGPLTYDLYWIIAQLPSNQIISRTINFLADAGTTYFVASLCRKIISPNRSLLAATAWTFFPISVFNSIVGQIDALPVFVTVAAVYYASNRRPGLSLFLIALGFNLKLYPLLLLPIVVWTYRKTLHPIQLMAGLILPFLLGSLILLPTASLSGFTPTSIITMIIQRMQNRIPSGTSALNLLLAQFPQTQIVRQLYTAGSYLAITILVVAVTVRRSGKPQYHLITGSALIIFASVNLAIEVQSNYVLWYYPLIVATILIEAKKLYLAIQLSILSLIVVLNNLFASARLTQITHDSLAANSSYFDLVTIAGYQVAAWLLFIILWRRTHQKWNAQADPQIKTDYTVGEICSGVSRGEQSTRR